jgi:hypothetical protein
MTNMPKNGKNSSLMDATNIFCLVSASLGLEKALFMENNRVIGQNSLENTRRNATFSYNRINYIELCYDIFLSSSRGTLKIDYAVAISHFKLSRRNLITVDSLYNAIQGTKIFRVI